MTPARLGSSRRVAGGLLAIYLVVLAAIAVWPTPIDRPFDGTLFAIIGRLQSAGLGWVTYERIESASNALLFVPFGLLLAGLLGRGWRWVALGICVATTFAIEFVQQVLLPERHADVRDLVANSVGAALGILVIVVVDRIRSRPARSLDG